MDHSVVLWQRLDVPGLDRCALRADPAGGWSLLGTLVAAKPRVAVRYEVQCDRDWRTRAAVVRAQTDGGDRELSLEVDERGRWWRAGHELRALAGCLDVDVQLTPATNLLPIRRLALAVGASAAVTAAWIRFPELEVTRLEQRYTRLAEGTYRYESPGFTATLEVDERGLVVRYGDLWRRVDTAAGG